VSNQEDMKEDLEENKDAAVVSESGDSNASSVEESPVEDSPVEDSPVAESPAAKSPVEQSPPAAKKPFPAVAWLALLLVLGLIGGGAWLMPKLQQEAADLRSRVAQLESSVNQRQDNFAGIESRLSGELRGGLDQLEAKVEGAASQYSESLLELESELAQQRAEIAAFSANDRDSWLMAEAEYLLRLANQRLVMAGDTVAARALLNSADKVLLELDDVGLHEVRGAVAADLAALRAVRSIDTEGIYLRLAALVEQADGLVIFQMPEKEDRLADEPADNWQGRLQQGYESVLEKLSNYIAIRRRDVPMEALMDPQWEGLVRQNLRMLLEQAQVALLSGNQKLYGESLKSASEWVSQFKESDEVAAAAMSSEIRQLIDVQIAVDLPDISRSVRALDEVIEARLDQQRAGEG
jgi:uroporphyrin-III C-methyltransferase